MATPFQEKSEMRFPLHVLAAVLLRPTPVFHLNDAWHVRGFEWDEEGRYLGVERVLAV
jgi:hypothetical protein